MLIRSQDKKNLINLDNITRLTANKAYGNNETGWLIEVENQLSIGQYTTEAKAIKVLDAIESAYKNVESDYRDANDTYWQSIRDASLVFQMPEDSEVKEGAVKDE